jgi:hypothetical protein
VSWQRKILERTEVARAGGERIASPPSPNNSNHQIPGASKVQRDLALYGPRDNRSGAGSKLKAVDLNKDDAMDIVTATRFGTYVFWGKLNGGKESQKSLTR